MAVSQIEEKILGRLARQTEDTDDFLSASLYQVLGLSILLSRRLTKARRLRRRDAAHDSKSIELHYHIIWLAREGLVITESIILKKCQNGKHGAECRVMAAKLHASLHHIFCLFHNNPPLQHLQGRASDSKSSPPNAVPTSNGQLQTSLAVLKSGRENENGQQRRTGKPALRDPIPSMTSDASYITNPYAAGAAQTPPPVGPPPPIPPQSGRTPTHPPGLARINLSEAQIAASFLLAPLNFVPMTRDFFETAQNLATSLLSPANALRLSVTLEHTAFLWDCCNQTRQARHLARQTIKEVYASTEGLDDDEFADASMLVQALGGIVRRETSEPTSHQSRASTTSPPQPAPVPSTRPMPTIDRTIAISPPAAKRTRIPSPLATQKPLPPIIQTPERLSTVPELESAEASGAENATQPRSAGASSRISTTSGSGGGANKHRRPNSPSNSSTAASEKASKRRAVEHAEERYLRSVHSGTTMTTRRSSNASASASASASAQPSRQATPQEGYVAKRPRRRRNRNGGGNTGG